MKLAEGIDILDIRSELANGPGITHPAVLWNDTETLLIDGGLPSQSKDIRAFSMISGIPINNLRHIIITHSDMDHIGCLSSLISEIGNDVEIIAHENEKPYIDCEIPPIRLTQIEARLEKMTGEQYRQMKGLYEDLKANYKKYRLTVDRTVRDGEELPFFGGMTVIHTPGHTPGHICVYLPSHRILFAGDALNVESGQLVRCPVFTTIDEVAYSESLKKLQGYTIQTVVCFHGGIFSGDANRRIKEIVEETAHATS